MAGYSGPIEPGALDAENEKALWERLPVALYRTTPDGRISDVNPAFVECFHGSTRESLLQTWAEALYVDADDRARREKLVRARGVVRGTEAQMRRLDGTTFWARETSRLQCGAHGAPLFYEGLIEDVTENRVAQQALRGSELRYRRLFEAAKDGILILDAETAEIQDVNPFLCDLLGFSHQELLGRKLWEIGPFKDVAASKVNFRELQLTDYIRYDDLPLKTARGLTIAVEFVSNVYPVNGQDVIQCNVRDITERKKNEEEHRRLIRVVEQTAESIMMTDPQGTIVYVNPAFERVSGWTREEAIGQNPRILKSGRQNAAFYRQMWEALERGETWTGRLVNRRKDGTFYEEDATISPVRDAAGRVANYVAVKRDVSREVLLEQQLFQARKMEALGRLAGGAAHDFNNLLGVIAGYGENVHARLADGDPLKEEVEQILKAADRAAGLTRQLLALGRKQVLRPRILSLNSVVSHLEEMLRRVLGEGIELVTRLGPGLGSVNADPGQLEQVLINLVVNARDAVAGGGRVTLETLNAELDADYAATHAPTRPGSYVMLAITDTGAGMDAATLAQVFDPFFTTKEIGKGTGLGLSTVYGIVDQSGGFVWVYSEVGVGTTFRVYLPRVDEDARAEPEVRPRPLLRGTETVLLVEDEAALRELLRRALEANGYSVLVARDGGEALQIAEAHAGTIEILVTDVIMPGLTGPRTAELVARTRPRTKVLYVSGYSDESVTRNGLLAPGVAFLSKPFRLETLLRNVRALLDAE